ncbi:hypothetical protein [uncultured Sphingomonas sp.]|uniref:hypothetical protein n=1 Tax=uncultured Sphingomonas sp. TaxID=158754 RepID=UPI0025FC9CC5|nr:hypothetical protein [uncultured Sphingomonas sp.]
MVVTPWCRITPARELLHYPCHTLHSFIFNDLVKCAVADFAVIWRTAPIVREISTIPAHDALALRACPGSMRIGIGTHNLIALKYPAHLHNLQDRQTLLQVDGLAHLTNHAQTQAARSFPGGDIQNNQYRHDTTNSCTIDDILMALLRKSRTYRVICRETVTACCEQGSHRRSTGCPFDGNTDEYSQRHQGL